MTTQPSNTKPNDCMLRPCPQCGMEVDLAKTIRCPRCLKHMIEHLKCDGNCKKCSS